MSSTDTRAALNADDARTAAAAHRRRIARLRKAHPHASIDANGKPINWARQLRRFRTTLDEAGPMSQIACARPPLGHTRDRQRCNRIGATTPRASQLGHGACCSTCRRSSGVVRFLLYTVAPGAVAAVLYTTEKRLSSNTIGAKQSYCAAT